MTGVQTCALPISNEYYSKATADQRERLEKAFKNYGISRIVTLFDGYSGETFQTLGERDGKQGTKVVTTKLNVPSKDSVGITYVLKESDKRWYIIDALLDDNISQLSVYRSEYRKILAEQGVEGLIKTLNSKADELSKG